MGQRALIIWNEFENVRFFAVTNQEHIERLRKCHDMFINSDAEGLEWLSDAFYDTDGNETGVFGDALDATEPLDLRDFDVLVHTGFMP